MLAIKFHVQENTQIKKDVAIATVLKNGTPVRKIINEVYEKTDLKFLSQALNEMKVPDGIKEIIISTPSPVFNTAIAIALKSTVNAIAVYDPHLKGSFVVSSDGSHAIGDFWEN